MSDGQAVRVACRIFAPDGASQDDSLSCVAISHNNQNEVQVLPGGGTASSEKCAADFVHPPGTPQSAVYSRLVQPLIDRLVNENITVALVAFGASGSGKTHTLIGGPGEEAGMLPRLIRGLFESIAEKSAAGAMFEPHEVEATYYEVVGESIRDLFHENPDRTDLDVVEDPDIGATVKSTSQDPLACRPAKTFDTMLKDLDHGNKQNTSLEHDIAPSGDCSTVYTIKLTEQRLGVPESKRSCRFIVIELPSADPLAEDPAEIRARDGPDKHRGILAFSHLLRQLEGTTGEIDYADYQSSKLTRILEDVLGGNCFTTFIATLNSSLVYREVCGATVSHMKKLKRIVNHPVEVTGSLSALLRRLRLKIKRLAEQAAHSDSGAGVGSSGGKGATVEELNQRLMSIHNLEGRVIQASMNTVMKEEELDKLSAQFKALRVKYTELAAAKANLQQELITSEEDRLKIAQALIDLQVEKTQSSELVEKEKFELQSQVIAAQNEVVELEMRQKNEAGKIAELDKQVQALLEEKAELATEFLVFKNNLVNSRKETELQKRKNEELSIELLNLVNAREALAQEKDAMSVEHAEALASKESGQMTEAQRAELEALRSGSKELHEHNAKLKFELQQKDVEYGQLQLQLEKAVLAKQAEVAGQTENAEKTMNQLHADIVQLESELKKERRINKEQEADLLREVNKAAELNQELTQGRERLKAADRRFREQVKEHMDDLARLTAAATPRAEQLNQETRKLIDNMAREVQNSFAEREQTLLADLAAVRERLARAVRKNRLLFKGYRTLRHRIEDTAPMRGTAPAEPVITEVEVEEGELEEEGGVMEAELAVMRQRVNGLEEDLDRQRQKAITATEAYQKMVVDLQQKHASTIAELESALKEVDKLGGYRDLYSKLKSDGDAGGQSGNQNSEMTQVMRENLGLQRQLVELRQELEQSRSAVPKPDGSDEIPTTPELKEIQILRTENSRLNAELAAVKNDLAVEQAGGMASARAVAETGRSFHKDLQSFANQTQAQLEAELAAAKTGEAMALAMAEEMEQYMQTATKTMQQEIMHLRQLLADNGIEVPRGGRMSRPSSREAGRSRGVGAGDDDRSASLLPTPPGSAGRGRGRGRGVLPTSEN